MKRFYDTCAALLFTAGVLIAGAEVTDPAWWPWANLCGPALLASAAGVLHYRHRPAPRRPVSGTSFPGQCAGKSSGAAISGACQRTA